MIWSNNGGTGDQIYCPDNNFVINVSNKGKDDRRLFDVFISLKTIPEDRLLIEVTKKLTHSALFNVAKQALESKYDFLKGLSGLRVNEIKMVNPYYNLLIA